MADFGIDLAGVDDLSPGLPIVSGRLGLLQAIARRLITPRGSLFYDHDYGYDVRQFLSGDVRSTAEIASNVAAEAEKDERVEQASAKVTLVDRRLVVNLAILDGAGPFSFVLNISQVTVELLTQSA